MSPENGSTTLATALLTAVILVLALITAAGLGATAKHKTEDGKQPAAVLWRDPVDITSRDLFYGSGGQKDEPQGPFTFVKEDLHGANPKFELRDSKGVKWKAKLGFEARPETAASRLIWAAGYFTAEYYVVPVLRIHNLPTLLERGNQYIEADRSMLNVRLKRHPPEAKGERFWKWRHNRFSGTREFNGLRVMMSLINNWDLKDDNNVIYRVEDRSGQVEDVYSVSDLGSSFGTPAQSWSGTRSKGNLETYSSSSFIRRIAPGMVDFGAPGRPSYFVLVDPYLFAHEMHMRWIGEQIPRSDAIWIGRILSRLSRDQIRDAFRAAGYTPDEVEGFADAVVKRIAELNGL